MGLQAARPTSQVCCSSFNQCCGSGVLVSSRIRIQHFRSMWVRIRIYYGIPDSPAILSGLFQLVLWIRFGFQRGSGSSILGQCGFGSGFNMGLQAARPTPQVCLSSFNQCCGSATVVFNADPDPAFRSRRIRIRILGLINVAYPHLGSTAFMCFFCSVVGKVLVPVWNPDSFPTTKNLYINFNARCIIIFPFDLAFLNF
jgi:hypothetical protein